VLSSSHTHSHCSVMVYKQSEAQRPRWDTTTLIKDQYTMTTHRAHDHAIMSSCNGCRSCTGPSAQTYSSTSSRCLGACLTTCTTATARQQHYLAKMALKRQNCVVQRYTKGRSQALSRFCWAYVAVCWADKHRCMVTMGLISPLMQHKPSKLCCDCRWRGHCKPASILCRHHSSCLTRPAPQAAYHLNCVPVTIRPAAHQHTHPQSNPNTFQNIKCMCPFKPLPPCSCLTPGQQAG
jgi:hypothetical protein